MKLIVEPHDGIAPLLSAIKRAKKSIEIAIFRFDRRDLEAALKAAVERGVHVTALIANTNRGGETRLRQLELHLLEAGVIVARTDDDLIRYHDKFILIDRRTLYVLSFNFTYLDIDRSRGYGIITKNAKFVHEAEKLFHADSTRTEYVPDSPALVVSPENSRKSLSAFLKRAKRQLLIYDPKISDPEMLRILRDRVKAGVEIRVIGKIQGHLPIESRELTHVRLHTRTIIRDHRQAFVGSQSLRSLELDSRRELGLIVHDPKIVRTLLAMFESDWASAVGKPTLVPSEDELWALPPAAEESVELVHFKVTEIEAQREAMLVEQMLAKELDPITTTVKKAVKKVVAKVGDEALLGREMKARVKRVVKKAVKKAVKEAVQETVLQAGREEAKAS